MKFLYSISSVLRSWVGSSNYQEKEPIYSEGGSYETTGQWKSETKAMIVLEGLKGRPVGELGNTHQN